MILTSPLRNHLGDTIKSAVLDMVNVLKQQSVDVIELEHDVETDSQKAVKDMPFACTECAADGHVKIADVAIIHIMDRLVAMVERKRLRRRWRR